MKQLVVVLILIITAFSAIAQDVTYIRLKQERVSWSPKGFHITDVADDRVETAWIGQINKGGKKEKVAFQNGAIASIKGFIINNITQDKSKQPIRMHLSKIDVEVKKQGHLWHVDAEITFAFHAVDKMVMEYTGKGRGEMDTDPSDYIESFIRQAIENDLKRFDDWWEQNKSKIPTNPTVKVNVSMGKTIDKPNCIVYSLHRPLDIIDFTGRPEGEGMEMAMTTSGIGVGYSSQTENSQVVVDVIVTPYFSKPQSWFKPQARKPHVLAHEQTHFDITGIKACELVTAIRNATFTQENYVKLLEELQTKNSQEANEEESLYDNETLHGTIPDKQEAWEKKITEKVKTIGCY